MSRILLGGKIISLLTIFISIGVVVISSWTLMVLADSPNIENGEFSFLPQNYSSTKTNEVLQEMPSTKTSFSPKSLRVLRFCVCSAIIGGVLQLIVSSLILISSPEGFKSRLEIWCVVTVLSFFIILSSLLIPISFDSDSDSFLGIETFMENLGPCLTNLGRGAKDTGGELRSEEAGNGILYFFMQDINLYFIILFVDICFVFVLLLINVFILITLSMYK